MHIKIIDRLSQFDKIKMNWDNLYSIDFNANVTNSWAWMKGWLESTKNNWFVIAVKLKSNEEFISFFPLVYGKPKQSDANSKIDTIYYAGVPHIDYASFVCHPEYENEAIMKIAEYLDKKIKWNKFFINSFRDKRLEILIEHFKNNGFEIIKRETTPCPYVKLPDSWSEYFAELPSKNFRRKITRLTNKTKRENFVINTADNESIDNYIKILLELYEMRWGQQSNQELLTFKNILKSCFNHKKLLLDMMWQEDQAVAGLASFVDKRKGTIASFILVWNDLYKSYSPGQLMKINQIRYAIKHNYREYDFMRGDEDYKYQFNAFNRYTDNCVIIRKNLYYFLGRILRLVSAKKINI